MLERIFVRVGEVFIIAWVVLLVMVLFFFLRDRRAAKAKAEAIKKLKWINLEIHIPKENLKSPKAMEQVFSSFHAVEEWMAVEIVGIVSSIHFYIRLPENYRNLVESAIFSQYPAAEIKEADDYTGRFGDDLPNGIYDLFGVDFILAKENPYPIKSYVHFEEIEEEKRLDPLATIAEVMSNLKSDETIWLQILIHPTDDKWKKEAKDIIDSILNPKEKQSGFQKFINGVFIFIKNLILAPVKPPVWPTEEEKPSAPSHMTPGQQEVFRGIEGKVSKLGFEAALRFIYIDTKKAFTKSNVSAVMGALRQFNTQHLNSFTENESKLNFIQKIFFKEKKELEQKQEILKNYKDRAFPKKIFILNTEELATLYHVPLTSVGAQSLRRLETKKGGPPTNLPII